MSIKERLVRMLKQAEPHEVFACLAITIIITWGVISFNQRIKGPEDPNTSKVNVQKVDTNN